MNSPAIALPNQLAAAAQDLRLARQGLEHTLTFVREQAQPWALSGLNKAVDDPYIIGKFGDLHIRIEVADALYQRAEHFTGTAPETFVATAEAVIASAEALQAVGNVQQELTGSRPAAPSQEGREPLRWQYQIIGNHRLNGVVPPQLQE
ncbi:acyl-CoA dehydrogenase [Pseudomonas sp. CCC3.1]|uniref:acyl-CoA dehydrogenase n=1 Tax=Pseudomonas sp. CCC3.1 TaxID=3048607 RepID=UPI002AC98034|nr:acyl-CoA dehydrogenase [Pseudomonas sp. CCC3.1]MEB0207609.1 acyl-CoA dehydrogenase [Pseudomonas sp. CCC3.1]WPX38590.1 acyl-CoA dehydrogenase [Pseudomonas sp. CCC3.1]